MRTYAQQFQRLTSDSPSVRGIAALVLNRSRSRRYKDAVRQMVLQEEHYLPLMYISHAVVAWNDETLDKLLAKIQDERVLFTLLEAARRQKRKLPESSISELLKHKSVFVRIAALKHAIKSNVGSNLALVAHQIRTDADEIEFVALEHMPSPIFLHKSEFTRLISRLQWFISHSKS